jgi:hypothetical protein
MFRQSYLLVLPAAANATRVSRARAHWAMLILEAGSEIQVTVIQMVGILFSGYGVELSAAMTPAQPDGSIRGLCLHL